VQFSSLVANIIGNGQEEITLPEGATCRDLLNMLVGKYGKDFRNLLMTESGQLRQLAHIMVNGQDVTRLGDIDVSLDGIPQVSIVISVPPISGG
jgi:molybdopterin converting factor small subunit